MQNRISADARLAKKNRTPFQDDDFPVMKIYNVIELSIIPATAIAPNNDKIGICSLVVMLTLSKICCFTSNERLADMFANAALNLN